jgi:mannose-6-phosphate isomerase-like protein (cupin superfamily)
MQVAILQSRPAREYPTAEPCWIEEVANDAGDPEVSIARARVLAGVCTAWHRLLGVSERYLIISGQGSVELGDASPAPVGVGDVVRIPPGVAQRIRNTGPDDLVFYCICQPRFRPACYEALECAREAG